MKRLLTVFAAVGLCAGIVFAKPQRRTITITLDASGETAGTNQTADVYGYIDEILISVSDGASAGACSVSYAPEAHGTNSLTAVTLATATVTDEKRFRPSVDRTDTAGSDLSSDPPERYMVFRETITFVVTASTTTNATWRCLIKYDDGK